jgi:hypothetical protein
MEDAKRDLRDIGFSQIPVWNITKLPYGKLRRAFTPRHCPFPPAWLRTGELSPGFGCRWLNRQRGTSALVIAPLPPCSQQEERRSARRRPLLHLRRARLQEAGARRSPRVCISALPQSFARCRASQHSAAVTLIARTSCLAADTLPRACEPAGLGPDARGPDCRVAGWRPGGRLHPLRRGAQGQEPRSGEGATMCSCDASPTTIASRKGLARHLCTTHVDLVVVTCSLIVSEPSPLPAS